jgi:hypothetical protein
MTANAGFVAPKFLPLVRILKIAIVARHNKPVLRQSGSARPAVVLCRIRTSAIFRSIPLLRENQRFGDKLAALLYGTRFNPALEFGRVDMRAAQPA